jgi:hypothetical protein
MTEDTREHVIGEVGNLFCNAMLGAAAAKLSTFGYDGQLSDEEFSEMKDLIARDFEDNLDDLIAMDPGWDVNFELAALGQEAACEFHQRRAN